MASPVYQNVFEYLNQLGFQAAGGGYLAPQSIANQVIRLGRDNSLYSAFLTEATDSFGVSKGTTFTFKRLDKVTQETVGSHLSPLGPGTSIPYLSWSYGSHQISAQEYGVGYSFEDWARYTSAEALSEDMAWLISDHVRVFLDTLARNVVFSTNKAITMVNAAGSFHYGTNAPLTTNNIKTYGAYASAAGIAAGTSIGNGEITFGALAKAHDLLKKSDYAIGINGKYPAILNTRTARQIKNLLRFENNVQMPQIPDTTFLGDAEGFLWYETEENTQDGVIAIVPEGAFGMGFALRPQFWFYPDILEDAGRGQGNKVRFGAGYGALLEQYAKDKGDIAALLIKVGINDTDYVN